MKKKLFKVISLILTVAMITSGLVLAVPASFAASFPTGLRNGNTDVVYTASEAQQGKYLVEIDAVKYTANFGQNPGAIATKAGDITVVYKPNNGTDPEQTVKFDDCIPANAFNYDGKGQFEYYVVLDGFPKSASVSVQKANGDNLTTGIYTGLKVWNADNNAFESIYDFSEVSPSNGDNANYIMISEIAPLLQYYPVAKSGTTSGSNLTLPAGQTANSAMQVFSVVDQWGVMMMHPTISYQSLVGLSFSQEKNTMTVYGTGDANNPAGNTRNVTLRATYESANDTLANDFSITRTFTITNNSSTNPTFAPTYDNRTRAGITMAFKAGNTANPDKFDLNSSYKMTTTNTVVLTNHASRAASVSLSTTESGKVSISPSTATIAAGSSASFNLTDRANASSNYTLDITASYTLEGFRLASTNELVELTTTSSIACIYNKVTTPTVQLKDSNFGGAPVDCDVSYVSNAGVLNYVSSEANDNMSKLTANYYVDTSKYSTYQSAGLGFYFKPNNTDSSYTFQPNENDAGYYVQRGTYANAGTFGFSASAANSAHTSRYCEKVNTSISSSGTKISFYGTIFTCVDNSDSPAQIYFDGDQDNDDGVELLAKKSWRVNNAAYLNSTLNIYAYNKSGLRNKIKTLCETGLLSCYYNATKWSNYNSAGSSALKSAQTVLGTDITTQQQVTTALNNVNALNRELLNSSTNATYVVTHYKHEGDINSVINGTSVNFYMIASGAQSSLPFNDVYAGETNKHTAIYTARISESGTFTYTYNYWNIDFSRLTAVTDLYNSINVNGQFSNTQQAIGTQLNTINSIDTNVASASPLSQNDVDNAANDFMSGLRKLEYTSYDMRVKHVMKDPFGSSEINNEFVETYTAVYNKTATYGEVMDGTVNISDGTYTIKNYPFIPTSDPNFEQYASRVNRPNKINEVKESREVTVIYIAKEYPDSTLDTLYEDAIENFESWSTMYTVSTINNFAQWLTENTDNEKLTKIYSIFEEEEYNTVLAQFQAELDKLDPIITAEQKSQLNQYIRNYKLLGSFKDAFCNGAIMQRDYAPAYNEAQEILALESENDAGSKAAQAVLDKFADFKLQYHQVGERKLLTAPKDGIDGSYYLACSKCGNVASSGVFGAPHFNTYSTRAYDYTLRGASLRIKDEDVSSRSQEMRFAGSCLIPSNATVKDFGFVVALTSSLNGDEEPTDNNPVNVERLVETNKDAQKISLFDGNYTSHDSQEGTVYTFNLVLDIEQENWNKHYAARSYVTYSIDGVETTVYDKTYSSRSVMYIATKAFENPFESPRFRGFLAQKFALSE